MIKKVVFVGNARDTQMQSFKKKNYGISLFASSDSKLWQDKSNRKLEQFDFVMPVSFVSRQQIEKSLKGFYINPNTFLYTDSEKYLLSQADIAAALSIRTNPFLTHENAVRLTSKFQQRRAFAENFPEITVAFKRIKTFHGAYMFTRKHGFPVIVKPVHLSQSQLVEVCSDLEELISKVSYIFAHIEETYADNGVNRKPAVIIEQFITGRQYSVDSYIDADGVAIHTPICKQTVSRDIGGTGFETVWSGYPSYLSDEEELRVYEAVDKSIKALGVKGNPTHIEVKIMPEGTVKIIEVNLRNGGMRATLLDLSFGIDHIDNTLKTIVGEPVSISQKILKYSAVPQFWAPNIGDFEGLKNREKVQKLKSFVSDRLHTSHMGREVGPAEKGYPKLYYAILAHKNEAQLQSDLQKARELLKVIVK